MGFKFRKSVKIAPGVRVNLSKKSASVSIGGKGFRKTYSTSGRKTTTVSIPGSGLSYSKSTSAKKKSTTKKAARTQSYSSRSVEPATLAAPTTPLYWEDTYRNCSIGFFAVSVPLLLVSLFMVFAKPAGFTWLAISLSLFAMGFVCKKLAYIAHQKEEPIRLARNAELLKWQNAVCEDKSEKLFMSTKQLEEATVQAVTNDIRIFDDCSNILNKTSNPSVFFQRLALAEEKLTHLCSLEPHMASVNRITMNEKPSDLYKLFMDNKEQYVCDFLYKYYQTVKDKAETLKTERGKQNQYQKFYDSLQPYFDQISEKNKEYVEAMYQQKI